MAISGVATISGTTQYRWDGAITASSLLTQGGNVTAANLASTELTSKWASYFGTVSGTIRLSDTQSGNAVYVWTYALSSGGDVCVSTGSAQAFSSPVNASNFTNMDSVFATTGSPDNASATFNTTCPALTLDTGAMTGFAASRTQASSTFTTCAGTFGGAIAIGDHGFCTSINSSGTNYNATATNYELIVPTGTSNRTYYFYMELG